jgi:hypothetical protein
LIRRPQSISTASQRGGKPGADRPRRLKPGTVLLREYQGERHTVTLVPIEGFVGLKAQARRHGAHLCSTALIMPGASPRRFSKEIWY